jgi:co-chaperonin GroES (HSP10)
MKFTTAFGIASNTPFGGLTAKGLEESVKILQKGDVVYFSYLACDDENLFDTTEKHYLYRVPVHHLVAVKRGGFFEAVSGKVIIRPEEEKEFESRVLISVNNRKKIAHGHVISCSDGMREHFRCGQKVAYMERLAEWIEINGVKYDFVYTHEILGTL